MLSRKTIEAYLFFLLRHRLAVSAVVALITIVLGYPVRNDAGTVVGVLGFGVNLERLQTVFAAIPLPEGSVVTLTDRTSRVLARSLEPKLQIALGQHAFDGAMPRLFSQGQDVVEDAPHPTQLHARTQSQTAVPVAGGSGNRTSRESSVSDDRDGAIVTTKP